MSTIEIGLEVFKRGLFTIIITMNAFSRAISLAVNRHTDVKIRLLIRRKPHASSRDATKILSKTNIPIMLLLTFAISLVKHGYRWECVVKPT